MWKWQICHICLFFLSHQFHSHFLNGLADKRWRRGITKRVNLMAQPPSPGQGIIITMLIAIAKITATMFYVMIMMVVMFRLMVMFLVLTHLSWVLSWGLERQNRKRKYNVCFSGDSFEFNYSNGKMEVSSNPSKNLSTLDVCTVLTDKLYPQINYVSLFRFFLLLQLDNCTDRSLGKVQKEEETCYSLGSPPPPPRN